MSETIAPRRKRSVSGNSYADDVPGINRESERHPVTGKANLLFSVIARRYNLF